MLRVLRHTATVALLAGAAAPAAAQAVYYGQNNAGIVNPAIISARANFLGALTGVGTESFESIAVGASAPISLGFPGAGTATLTGSGQVFGGPSSGAFATSGSRYFQIETSTGGDFTINFTSSIAAFGFFGTDLGDAGSNLILRFTRAVGGTFDVQVPYNVNAPGGGLPNGNLLYFGYIDTANPLTSVQFRSTGSGDVFGFDDMTIGTAQQVSTGVVPEPSTYLLMATGLAALAGIARRRRTHA